MAVWKYSRWDAAMLVLSIAQLAVTFWLAARWDGLTWPAWGLNVLILTLMMAYNIIVISHFFTHTPWFNSPAMNAGASLLNSINIGQSVQAYHLNHVRNHHRYNNDQGKDGSPPADTSSTFIGGVDGEHVGLIRYAFAGAARTLVDSLIASGKAICFWKPHAQAVESELNYSRTEQSRAREVAQLRWDRIVQAASIGLLCILAWDWVLFCYLPALYLAFAAVNVQNYYEHYGANPDDQFANSVSYYGRFYNFIAFNDGHHQEHHLAPSAHWRKLPEVYQKHAERLSEHARVISSVPAIIGFLDRKRSMLHRKIKAGHSAQEN